MTQAHPSNVYVMSDLPYHHSIFGAYNFYCELSVFLHAFLGTFYLWSV